MIPDFEEKGAHEKGFSQHYNKKIKPVLQKIEDFRLLQFKTYKKRRRVGIPVTILLGGGGFLFSLFLLGKFGGDGEIIVIAPGLAAAFWMGWVRAPIRKYHMDVKTKIMPVVCEFFGELKYSHKGQLRQDILNLDIIPRHTRRESEDFIAGKYKSFAIQMNELTLKRKQQKSHVTVFSGLLIVISYPKSFKGKTVLKRDAGRFGNWANKIRNLERIELEDPDFEKIFEVYGSDQVEARYLLTTAFMQRLLNLAALRSQGKESKPAVQCEFVNKELTITIPSKQNLFEPGPIHKTALNHDDIHLFLSEMNELFELIKTLKLDRI